MGKGMCGLKCQQCRQPLEEWEAGLCEGCGMCQVAKHAGEKSKTTECSKAEFAAQITAMESPEQKLSIDAVLSVFDRWNS